MTTDPEKERLEKMKEGLKKPIRRPAVKPRIVPPKPGGIRPKPAAVRPKPVMRPLPAPPQVKVMAEHTVVAEDTLSGISLKYYGSAAKKFYMYIYNFNKDVIGDNPNLIRQGTVLKIPEKPEL